MANRKIDEPFEVTQDRVSGMDGAIQFMRKWLTENIEQDVKRPLIDVIRESIKENPKKWYIPHHFGWGMSMRNLLRENGYGEKDLGVDNLDDYYVDIIEKACAK